MKWSDVWMACFGTTTFCGLDVGFWIAMALVALIVVAMNVVFWNLKPKGKKG